MEDWQPLIDAVVSAGRVSAMTGAGVSTLSGIPDFRGPQGLYKNPDAERIFDIDWFDRDPSVYYRGCRELVYGLGEFSPGPVHLALKRLEDAGRLDGIITQNIDMLHQKAGSTRVWEVHGSPILHHCRRCGAVLSFGEVMALIEANGGIAALGEPYVPRCACGGVYKPDITFFGEALPEEAFVRSQELAAESDVMLVLGTSLTVFPAAGLPRVTLQRGGKVFIVNAQPTPLDDFSAARYSDLAEFAAAVMSAFQDGR
ncbi:MAG: NAD-dependent deacetylase [Kiritimatiellae bacterium]|nr:NAD-dependent deacetylase [Kiritimatiellia bacterium]